MNNRSFIEVVTFVDGKYHIFIILDTRSSLVLQSFAALYLIFAK
jgi:hypothetical protein